LSSARLALPSLPNDAFDGVGVVRVDDGRRTRHFEGEHDDDAIGARSKK
jgi:hypothetical protein